MNIGIAAYSSKGTTSINTAYLDYVSQSGFNPILITKDSHLDTMTTICDGLLLPGGVDIEPTFYKENNVASSDCLPEKDDFERKLMLLFAGQNKHIFGICRGFQLIVREFLRIHEAFCTGYYFYQHINEHNLVSARNVARNVPTHSVKANMQRLYAINAVDQEIFINSIHHQALVCTNKQLTVVVNDTNSLRPLAITDFGAPKVQNKETIIVEAVDVKLHNTYMRGVQWHPEELMDTSLLTNFFTANKAKAEIVQNGPGNRHK